MEKIIIFYAFTPLADPDAVRLWQRTLCERYNLLGRIIIAPHGINATVGGELENLKAYVRETRTYPAFRLIDVKWSTGKRSDFPRLSVKVRPELVAFGAGEELQVDATGVVGGGTHLKPQQVHELIDQHDGNVVFFDGRNAYEAAVGKFKDAIVPDAKTSKDFLAELDSPKYDAIKDKPVVTYCTGGIRCEILSALMINRGFKDVYQIDGGIIRYGKTYPRNGLWEGSLYVFDNRMGTKFSQDALDIGSCARCGATTSQYQNCANPACHELILLCQACAPHATCSSACEAVVSTR